MRYEQESPMIAAFFRLLVFATRHAAPERRHEARTSSLPATASPGKLEREAA